MNKYFFIFLSYFSATMLNGQTHWELVSDSSFNEIQDFVLTKKGELAVSIKGNDLIFQTNIFNHPIDWVRLPKVSTKFFRYDLNPINLFLDFSDTLIALRGAIPYRYDNTRFFIDSIGRLDTNYSTISISYLMKYNLNGDLFGELNGSIIQYKDKWKNDRSYTVFNSNTGIINYFPFSQDNNYALIYNANGDGYSVVKYNTATSVTRKVFETNTPMDYRDLTVTSDGHIFAGTSLGLYHSYNDGQDFELCLVDSVLGHTSTTRVCQTKSGNAVLVKLSSGFFASYDKGKTWKKLYLFGMSLIDYPFTVWEKVEIIDTAHAAILIRNGCFSSGVFLLTPNSIGWIKINPPSFKLDAYDLFKNLENRLFIQENQCKWIFSDSEGKEWKSLECNGHQITKLHRDRKDQLYCFFPDGLEKQVLYKSKDNGESWDTNHIFPGRLLSFSSFNDGSILLLTGLPDNGSINPYMIYYSSDYGQNWQLRNNYFAPPKDVSKVLKGPDGTFYAFLSGTREVMKSSDLGQNWQVDQRFSNISNLNSPFFDERSYFVFIGNVSGVHGIYRSLDLVNFDYISTGLSVAQGIYSIAPGVLVASFSKDGMYITYDYGINWTNITGDLEFDIENRSYRVNSILVDQQGKVFLARAYDGIHRTLSSVVNTMDVSQEEGRLFHFHPNPTEDFVNIQYNDMELGSILRLELTNSVGKILHLQNDIGPSNRLDLSQMQAGIYYLSARTKEGRIQTKKIIKY
ncbi:MAG: T9SS type A sorting domain-containing protein [Saprospiraceae bacterium]|nr:T9SS type A sorting domain-containing protein [Saprospiraceae bacterium]